MTLANINVPFLIGSSIISLAMLLIGFQIALREDISQNGRRMGWIFIIIGCVLAAMIGAGIWVGYVNSRGAL